jgi:hypothetical protein
MTQLSKCCSAPLKVAGGKEGTNWYECEKCGKTPSESVTIFEQEVLVAHIDAIRAMKYLSYVEWARFNPSLANEYRTIASAIETRYQTLKRMGEK